MATIQIPQQRITELPEFQLYASHHPAFSGGDKPTPLAREHLRELCTFDTVAVNVEKAIVRRIEIIQIELRIKAQQMVGNEVWGDKKPATEQEWKKSPRTLVKTAQERITDPVDRMAFSRDELTQPGQIDTIMQHIIGSVGRVNDTLLTNLKLDKYIPPKGTKRKEALTLRGGAIPEIQKMLANLEPFTHAHEVEDESQQRYFRLMRTPDGDILGTQRKADGEVVLFRTDIYGAQRRLEHIMHGSQDEIKALAGMRHVMEKILKSLTRWHMIKNTSAIPQLRSALSEIIDRLEFVEKDEKVRMRELVKKALTVRYKGGQQNPRVMTICLEEAIRSIGKRMAEIGNINTYLAEDKTRLTEKVEMEELPTIEFLKKVEKNRHQLKATRPASNPLTPEECRENKAALVELLEGVKGMQHEPNRMFAEKYQAVIKELQTQLDEYGDGSDATKHNALKKNYVKLYALGKLHRTMIELKKLLFTVSVNPQTYDPQDVIKTLKELDEKMRHMRIAQDVTLPQEMKDAYIEVYEHMREVLAEAEKSTIGTSKPIPTREPKPTLSELLMKKISSIPGLERVQGMLERFGFMKVHERPKQQIGKQETAKTMKELLKGFSWEDVLEAF